MVSGDLRNGGELVGHGVERRGAEQRRPGSGGAAWHRHARGDHARHHADIGIEMILSAQGSKKETDRVTLRKISNPTEL